MGSARDQLEYRTFYNGLGGWRRGGFGSEATTTVEDYKVGTLVLDMYDTQSKRLVWRGTASDSLSDKPEKNEKKAREIRRYNVRALSTEEIATVTSWNGSLS